MDPQTNGLPKPAGTNENGEPYWIINGQEITWQQMQQLLWQQMQAAKATSVGGPEQIPQMVTMPNFPEDVLEVSAETAPEKGPEMGLERRAERKAEVAAPEKASGGDKAAQPKPANKQRQASSPWVGDTAQVEKVDFADVDSMFRFYEENKQGKGDPEDSSTFLAAFIGKLIRILAASTK